MDEEAWLLAGTGVNLAEDCLLWYADGEATALEDVGDDSAGAAKNHTK